MNPILSIIIPCYNRGKYIQEALDSINLAREGFSLEVIIVNDGSTDPYTIEKIKTLEQEGYIVVNQFNGGLGNARNNGIKLARGKYILPLDDDNMVLKPYLYDALVILEERNDIGVVYGNAEFFGERNGLWEVEEYNLRKILAVNYIDACAIFRKELWEKVGGYDEKMPYQGNEDWEFWVALGVLGVKFYHLKKVAFKYRVVKNSMIRSLSHEFKLMNYDYVFEKYNKQYQKFYSLYEKNERQYRENLKSKKFVINLFTKMFFGFKIYKMQKI